MAPDERRNVGNPPVRCCQGPKKRSVSVGTSRVVDHSDRPPDVAVYSEGPRLVVSRWRSGAPSKLQPKNRKTEPARRKKESGGRTDRAARPIGTMDFQAASTKRSRRKER